jgi:hypothetical protein
MDQRKYTGISDELVLPPSSGQKIKMVFSTNHMKWKSLAHERAKSD